MKTFLVNLAIVVPLFGVFFGVGILVNLYGAYALTLVWDWHLVSVTGLGPPSLWSAFAAVVLVQSVTHQFDWYASDRETKYGHVVDLFMLYVASLFKWTIVLGLTYFAHWMQT